MAPPPSGGDKGGLGERPAHPKLTGEGSSAAFARQRAIMEMDSGLEEDGNWDDGYPDDENLGFQ
jgi:hypothetical protein